MTEGIPRDQANAGEEKVMRVLLKVSLALFTAGTALPAHAYVDPGTGSMVVQMIIGGVVAAAFMIKTYYYQLKAKLRSLFGRGGDEEAAAGPTASESGNTEQ